MSEKTISVAEATRHFSQIVRRAERNGSTVITRNGKAVARVVPAKTAAGSGRTVPPGGAPHVASGGVGDRFPFVGCLKGKDGTDVRRLADYLYGEGD